MSRSPILLAPVYELLRSLGLESRATIVARFSKPSERSELLTVADWLANVSFANSVGACLQTTSLPRLGKPSDYEEANC